LVVIGDKKTPVDYKLQRGKYYSPEEQEKKYKKLSDALGWNCVQRRNIGFLVAHEMGADVVSVVDDDNIPNDKWGKNLLLGKTCEVNYYTTDLPAFDPVGATEYKNLWHRGYPLQLLHKRNYAQKEKKVVGPFAAQADFWNGDPDIDAVCRMEHRPNCSFSDASFPIASNKPSPFNSQNTFVLGSTLKDYFMFPFVGRMDDIWGAYYYQAVGHRVVYGSASVTQERNVHDFTKDMKLEFLGYEKNLELVNALAENPELIFGFIPPNSVEAFKVYQSYF
jgi:hypothetical protein